MQEAHTHTTHTRAILVIFECAQPECGALGASSFCLAALAFRNNRIAFLRMLELWLKFNWIL